jgi:hypothetical protein
MNTSPTVRRLTSLEVAMKSILRIALAATVVIALYVLSVESQPNAGAASTNATQTQGGSYSFAAAIDALAKH